MTQTLTDSIFAIDRKIQIEVRIGGELLASGLAADGSAEAGNLTGVDIKYDIEQLPPTCSLTMVSIPSWVVRGMDMYVNAGYDGIMTRVFTGKVKRRRHTPRGHVIACVGRTAKLTRPYRTRPAKSFMSIGARDAIIDILDDAGVNFTPAFNEHYDIDAAVNDWTIGTEQTAYMDMARISDMIRKIADVDGNRVFETRAGTLRIRPLLEFPADNPFRTYAIGGTDETVDTTDSFSVIGSIDTDDVLGDDAARERRSQGWTPSVAGSVATLSLFLRSVGAPTDGIYFELYDDDGTGKPGTTLLGGTSKYNGQLLNAVTYTEVPLRIISGYELTAGTQYHIVVRRSGGADAVNHYELGRVAAGGYAGGAPAVYNGAAWAAVGGDYVFTAQIRAFATGRITNIADDEDEDQVKKRVTVRGAAIVSTDAEGNEITTQIEQTASTLSDDLVVGDPELFSAEYTCGLIQTDAKAASVAVRLVNKFHRILDSIEIAIPFDPELDLAVTLGLIDQQVTGKTGNWWVRAYTHSLTAGRASTSVSLFGGDQGGTQGCVGPRADFNIDGDRQLSGSALKVVLALDASPSSDQDGKIVNYRWQDDYAGGAMDQNGPDLEKITVAYDPSVDSEINITLTVTDDGCSDGSGGLTGSIIKTIVIDADNQSIYVPVIACAAGNTCMATFDGAQTWKDINTPSGDAVVAAITYNPSQPEDPVIVLFGTDNGRIYRSVDGMDSLVLEYTDGDGDPITDIKPDLTRRSVLWATTTDRVLLSVDYGNTWAVWTDFTDSTKWSRHGAGHVNTGPTDPRPINGILVSDPSVNRIWLFGGTGDVVESWFHTNYLPDGNDAWWSEIAEGGGVAAHPRDAGDTVTDAVVSHRVSGDLGLMFTRAGGGAPTNPYIYSPSFIPVQTAGWVFGGGAMIGVSTDGVGVAGNASQLRQFGAVLDDKTFYVSNDGINWWPIADVLPGTGANRPHHLISSSAWRDVFLVATDEGIGKSVDFGATWAFLRPFGAPYSTVWPGGAIGYHLAIEYRLPTSAAGLAAIVTSHAADATVETALAIRQAAGGWQDMGPLPTGRNTNPHRLWYFPSQTGQPYFYIRYTGATNNHDEDLYRSTDGTIWTKVLDRCGAITQAADGVLWATAEPHSGGHLGGSYQPHAVYKSINGGVDWTLVYEDTTSSVNVYTQYMNIEADPNDANRVMAVGQFPAQNIIALVTADATAGSPSFARRDTGHNHEAVAPRYISPKLVCGQSNRWMIGFQIPLANTDRIYTSDDDGISWQKRAELSPGSATFGFAQTIRAGMNIWFVGSMNADGARAYISRDNGLTWEAQTAPNTQAAGVVWNSSLDILFIPTGAPSGVNRIQYMLNPSVISGVWLTDPVTGLETAMGYTLDCTMSLAGMQVLVR